MTTTQEQVEHLQDIQRQFLEILFHELRTPLTGILGYIELARNAQEGEEYDTEEIMRGVERSAIRLKLLIDQVVSLKEQTLVKPFDVAEMLQSLLEDNSIWVATRRLPGQVSLAYTGDSHLVIEADVFKLKTAVLELIRNAIKATEPEGTVQVAAETENGSYLITVVDTGRGIEPERLEMLLGDYEAWDYLDLSNTRRDEGSGLGLAVIKHVVHMHGGQLTASSKLGEGSCFVIELPKHE